MRRSSISLADLADLNSLAYAFWRAAKGKKDRAEVQRFARQIDRLLDHLARGIRNETLSLGRFNHFCVHDPKPREISAPGFPERVLHHALIHHLGPVLERAAVYDSYACRKGKGPVRAVLRAQQHLRRFLWYLQIDLQRYFDSIDHEILKGLLRRRLKDRGVLALCDRIIDSYHTTPGCGLPIGALTSQYFANHYLDGLDRFLLETCKVDGMVRYMDDVAWWCRKRDKARLTLNRVQEFLSRERALEIKSSWKLQRSQHGMRFCGFRVLPGTILLSRRRKQRYRKAWRYWEHAYQCGLIDARQLQRSYDAVKSIAAHSQSQSFRRALHMQNAEFAATV